MQAGIVCHVANDLLSDRFNIVFISEVMFIRILGAHVALGDDVPEILFMRRQVAIDTFGTNTASVGAVDGKLPTLICNFHLMAFAAAVLRRRDRFHRRVNSNKAQYGEY